MVLYIRQNPIHLPMIPFLSSFSSSTVVLLSYSHILIYLIPWHHVLHSHSPRPPSPRLLPSLQTQCNLSSNGTSFNSTASSEHQVRSTTFRRINATDANQGVAVDSQYFLSIDNYSITKHPNISTNTTRALLQWHDGSNGPIIHLDGGVVINGSLYAPHSDYPQSRITTSIEVRNTTTMQHSGSLNFGINCGSLTWIDQFPVDGYWYRSFTNYDRVQPGQMLTYGLTSYTQLVRMDARFNILNSWIFPTAPNESFSPMSGSGGSFGPDRWLFITGHDAAAAWVFKIPSAGSVLI